MIGLTESPSALVKWILFAPELADIVDKYEQNVLARSENLDDTHHFDSESARARFLKDKKALEEYFENAGNFFLLFPKIIVASKYNFTYFRIFSTGNPFAEESDILYNIDTRRCCPDSVALTVASVEAVGQEQYLRFCEERLTTGSVSITEPIKQNRLPTFSFTPKATGKGQLKLLKKKIVFWGAYLSQSVTTDRPI